MTLVLAVLKYIFRFTLEKRINRDRVNVVRFIHMSYCRVYSECVDWIYFAFPFIIRNITRSFSMTIPLLFWKAFVYMNSSEKLKNPKAKMSDILSLSVYEK